MDNETLERVRGIDTTTRPRNSPLKGSEMRLPAVEESVESILDVSDLSFDETRDELGQSRHHLVVPPVEGLDRSKRRSSGPHERGGKRRKSRSLGALVGAEEKQVRLFPDVSARAPGSLVIKCFIIVVLLLLLLLLKVLSTTTKVTVDKEGNAHAESVIETVPVADLRKKARKSRESRGGGGERKVTYSERNQEFSPSAPPYEAPAPPEDDHFLHRRGGHDHLRRNQQQPQTPPLTHSPMVKRNFSNASNIHHRPHVWQKMSVVRTERCGPCGKRIGFSKSRYVCKECHAVCHLDCRENVSAGEKKVV